MKIGFLNLMSGMNITKGYWQYLFFHYKSYFPHSSNIVKKVAIETKKIDFDIFGTVEVDAGSKRTKGINQAKLLSDNSYLKHYRFFLTHQYKKRINQGNCIHSKYPISDINNHFLQGKGEPRYLSETKINYKGKTITVFVTHLSLKVNFRKFQIKKISDIINDTDGSIILMGDFNVYDHAEVKLLEKSKLQKAFTAPTFPSWNPKKHFDYIFLTKDFKVNFGYADLKKFSDHLMLIVDCNL